MTDFVFRVSPNVIISSYAASRLGQFACEFGKRFMLVLDPVLRSVGAADKMTQALSDRGVDFFIFDEIAESADTKAAAAALNLAKNSHIQAVIAVGGGKTIEIARCVAAFFYEEKSIYDFVDGEVPSKSPLPLVVLSTTCRCPGVFTDRIAICDSRTNGLKLLKVQNALCKTTVFDPTMSVTLTENQTFSMAVESVCLAAESYFSQKANFFSDMTAEKSAELLRLALDGSNSLNITTPKEELLFEGGCLASLASSASSFGPAGLLALAVNARFKISRPLVASIIFPYVIEFCAKFKADRVAKFADFFGIEKKDSETEQAQAFADNIRERLAKENLPLRLKELSITIEQLASVAEDAASTDWINFMPCSMTSDTLFEILKSAY